ncbi:MAG: hypothetical protein Q7T56_14210 [Nocardioidaceae bacterium]|nr:hypothetical protein [Nocardioidaceae bacterium]
MDAEDVAVVLAEVESPDAAAHAADELARTHPGESYAVIASTDVGVDLVGVLAALGDGMRELVCCDPMGPSVVPGHALSLRLLDDGVVGQDLAYTVPALEDAVDLARREIAREGSGWKSSFVVVLGPRPVLDLARRHLDVAD